MTSENHSTYDLAQLKYSAKAWEESSGLRYAYADLYHSIRARCLPGKSLELGAGIGVSTEFFENVTTSDVIKTPYVDEAVSAYSIQNEATKGGWTNIFALDMLHHLRFPMRFFASAGSALSVGGRLILVEPAATSLGRLFYQLCHHEPIHPQSIIPPFEFEELEDTTEFANMGMGVALFQTHLETVTEQLSTYGLRIREISFRDLLAYPLSGGYSKRQMAPAVCIRFLLSLERYIPQFAMKHLGVRMIIVLEKF